MDQPSFAHFEKTQATFEIRYEPAYLIWDRAGHIWTTISRLFTSFKSNRVSPNEVTFQADQRFSLNVSLERAFVIDHLPERNTERAFSLFEQFGAIVTEMLEIGVLNRVGLRIQYGYDCKTFDEAKRLASSYPHVSAPNRKLFNVEPVNVNAHYRVEIDDGELGYIAQIYPVEKSYEVNLTPELAAMKIPYDKKLSHQVIFDFDCMTKKPIPVASFKAAVWLQGWQRAINRDAETFLKLRITK